MAHDSDFLVTSTRCASCGQIDVRSLQLDVRDIDFGAQFSVGDALSPQLDYLGVSYDVLRLPDSGEPLRIIVEQDCLVCKYTYTWAEVVFAEGRIASATGVALDRNLLEHAHAIDELVREAYRDHLGVDLDPMSESERAAYIIAHPLAEPNAE